MTRFFRPSRRLSPAILGILLAFLGSAPSLRATIRYSISLDHPERHLFHVEMQIPDVSGEVVVQMAAWNALYRIADFSSHVQQVEAFVGDQPTPIEKLDKQTWRITGKGTITVRYAAYWDEPGPFASQLNAEHAFLNPAMVLLYVGNRSREDVAVTFTGEKPGWSLVTSAPSVTEQLGGTRAASVSAKDYDELADSPMEFGPIKSFVLPNEASHITVAVHGDAWKQEHVSAMLQKICAYEISLMGGAPFKDYTFILHMGTAARGGGGGGMEHSYSTAISVPTEDYLASVAAHEFFHLWNVKRIRPTTLVPVDYSKEQFTRALWFAEGVTNTYASYTLVRTGIWSKDRFLEDLSTQISEIESRPANRWQSAEQSSLDAWFEKYALYNRPSFSVSYYAKGQILGFLLDILIRDRTNKARCLDDVLRAMYADFAKKDKPYRDSLDVRLTAERVAGGSFESFFQKYVSGIEPFPYADVLALAGLELRTTMHTRASAGFMADRGEDGFNRVADLDTDSPAAQAGLREGDTILRWNDSEVPQWLGGWLAEHHPGEKLRLRIRRDNKEMSLDVRLGETKETHWQVVEANSPSEKARQIRDGLLRGVTDATAQQ